MASAHPKRREERARVRNRRGPTAIDFCLTAALLSVVIIWFLSALGTSLQSQLDTLSAAISAPDPAAEK